MSGLRWFLVGAAATVAAVLLVHVVGVQVIKARYPEGSTQ